MTKVACLADTPDDVIQIDKRLKWSKPEFSLAMFLVTQRDALNAQNVPSMTESEKLNFYKKLKARIDFNMFGGVALKRVANYDLRWAGQLAIFMNENSTLVDEITGNNLVDQSSKIYNFFRIQYSKMSCTYHKRINRVRYSSWTTDG